MTTVNTVSATDTGIEVASGDFDAGTVIILAAPLSLNNGGELGYPGGSGTSAVPCSDAVAATQNTSDLTITAINLNGANVTVVSVSVPGLRFGSGILAAGEGVTRMANFSEKLNLPADTSALNVNDGCVAILSGAADANTANLWDQGVPKPSAMTIRRDHVETHAGGALSVGKYNLFPTAIDRAGHRNGATSAESVL